MNRFLTAAKRRIEALVLAEEARRNPGLAGQLPSEMLAENPQILDAAVANAPAASLGAMQDESRERAMTRDMALAAVERDGLAVCTLPEKFLDDREIVQTAMLHVREDELDFVKSYVGKERWDAPGSEEYESWRRKQPDSSARREQERPLAFSDLAGEDASARAEAEEESVFSRMEKALAGTAASAAGSGMDDGMENGRELTLGPPSAA